MEASPALHVRDPRTQSPALERDWPDLYSTSATWGSAWQAMQDPSAAWPDRMQLRAGERQFLYKDHKVCVPESVAMQLISEWHDRLGHPGQRAMQRDLTMRFAILGITDLIRRTCAACQLC